jgi:SagB-type dehydrogenase family enzyme
MTTLRVAELFICLCSVVSLLACRAAPATLHGGATPVALPPPRMEGEVSLEAAIAGRRSVRAFTDQALALEEVGQLLWAAQGVTDLRGLRAAPSAGALYPLELYVALPDGLYHYVPADHSLVRLSTDDLREGLWQAGVRQDALREAPVVFVFAAVMARTSGRYGARAPRYVHMEIGHAAQNLALQAVALGLGSVPIGAMDDAQVQRLLRLPDDHEPLYLVPVGHPAGD